MRDSPGLGSWRPRSAVRAQPDTTGLGGCQGGFRSFPDHIAFMLSEGRHDVQHEPGGVRHVHGQEIGLRLHRSGDERHAAGKPVELGDQQRRRLLALAGGKGVLEFGPVAFATALDLDVFGDHVGGPSGQILVNGFLLRFQSEAGAALAVVLTL